MKTKKCSKCGEIKPLNEFHKQKSSSDGYRSRCKICRGKKSLQKYINSLSPEELKKYKQKKKRLQLNKKLLKENKFLCAKCGKVKKLNKFSKNPSTPHGHCYVCKDCNHKYNKKYRNKMKQDPEWVKHRRYSSSKYRNSKKNDPQFKLNKNISNNMQCSLKGNKNGKHWEELVGYTLVELKQHLKKQFTDEMSFSNYGKFWEIDHITPISSFNFTKPEHFGFRKCWSLDNLKPLKVSENRSKNDKLIKDKQEYLVI